MGFNSGLKGLNKKVILDYTLSLHLTIGSKHNGDILTKNFKVIRILVVGWGFLAQDRDHWRPLTNRGIKLRAP
jgi:hypothetical protein